MPSGLLLGLGLASGGFFPDSTSVAAVAVLAIFSARAMLSRTALAGLSPGALVIAAALIVFTVLTLVSGSWSGSWARAMFAYDLVLLYAAVFVLIGTVCRSTARARVLLLSLAVVSVGISIAAVATWLLPDLLPVARDIPRERLSWPTSYWNVTGLIGALGLVWAFSLSCSSAERAGVRVLAAMAVPWPTAMLIFTASRGATAVALLGLAVSTAMIRSPATPGGVATAGPAIAVSATISLAVTGLNVNAPTPHALHTGHQTMILLFVISVAAGAVRTLLLALDARIAAARAPWTRAQVRGALGVAAATLAIAFLVLGGPNAVRTAVHKFVASGTQGVPNTVARQRLTQFGSNGRVEAWRVALDDGFLRHPIDGNGAGTYATLWTRYGRSSTRILNAHSLYLEVLAELGILGGGILIAVVVSILVALARRARGPGRSVWAALFAGALMWAVHAGVDWDWQMPAATAWFFAAGGLALASPVQRPQRQTRLWVRLAIGLGSLVLVITPAAVWRSQTQIVQAVHAFERGNCISAQRHALASSSALISRWDPFEVISYCQAGAHHYSLALDAIAAAEKRDPDNWELRYSEALIRASAGLDPRPAARVALELYPLSPLTRAASSAFSRGGPREWRRFARFSAAATAGDEAVAARAERWVLAGRYGVGPPLGGRIRGASSVEVTAALQEEGEVGRRLDVVAAQAPPPRRLSAIEVALLVEQHPEVERGIAIPSALRALIRRRRGSEVAPLMQQHTQVERAPRVPRRVSAAIRQLRVARRRHWLLNGAAGSFRSRPPLGRRVRPVSSLEVTAALEEEAEVGRRLDVVAAQAPPPRRLSAIEVALLVEQHPEVERGIAIPSALRAFIRRQRRQRSRGAGAATRPG